jgi:hypothetical protein
VPRLHAYNNVKNVIFDLCRAESETIVGNFAMVVWCIWQHRNNWVWNGVKDSAKEVALRAVHMIGEWRAVNTVQQSNVVIDIGIDLRSSAAAYQQTSRVNQGD